MQQSAEGVVWAGPLQSAEACVGLCEVDQAGRTTDWRAGCLVKGAQCLT